jgi:N-acyl-L-homoserine lactone synthetase
VRGADRNRVAVTGDRNPSPPAGATSSSDGDATVDDGVATGDAVAAEILASLAPLRFREATNDDEREACLRLRYNAVLEMRMASLEEFSDGVETDAFDADAIHILGDDGGRPIATSRIVLPTAGRLLPTEAAFGLRLSNVGGLVEWGRVVVDPDYRGDGHSVFMGLAARSWLSMRERGYTSVIGATPERLIMLFEALGFSVTVLGEPQSYWGEVRYPILCESQPAIRRLKRDWLGGSSTTPSQQHSGDTPSDL